MLINSDEITLNKRNLKIDIFFYIGYLLALLASFFKHIMIEIPSSILFAFNLVSIILVCFFMLLKGIKQKYFIATLILMTISVLSFFSIKNIDVASFIFIIIASQNLEFQDILKFYFTVIFSCLMIVVLLSAVSIIPNLVFYQNERVRMSLGTIYPTVFASYFFFLILSYLLIREKNTSWFELVSISILNVLVLQLTDARSAFLNTTIIIIGMVILKLFKYNFKISKLTKIFINSLALLVPFIIVYLSYNYKNNSSLYYFLNNALTGRLYYANKAFYMYNVNLFGQEILMNGSGRNSLYGHEYFYLDSLVIEQLFSKGLILLVFYLTATYKILKKFVNSNRWVYVLAICVVILYDVTDNKSFRISYNPILLALFSQLRMNGGKYEQQLD
ncbi:hypothetical protein [Vagococcus lutrae]|uniref:hypothetical protein n=1 Tax=Vagococcus lutrae TaxID=81947 RepID=UPI000F8981F3|nr:hypothetical protein [Vagococcus lutrae]RST93837.1 hypothetical protein CBF33_01055 [Vagococcus lutrae]